MGSPTRVMLSLCAVTLLSGMSALQPEEVQLLQQSRYGDLERLMEGRIDDIEAAPTQQLFYLCFAYSRVKRYDKLFPCADALQRNVDAGDRFLFTFDFTLAPVLMKAEANIDLGRYDTALDQAQQAFRIMRAGSTYVQMDVYTYTALGLAQAFTGNADAARATAGALARLATDAIVSSDKYIGLAKIHMALGDFAAALEALERHGESAGFRQFVDFISGAGGGASLFTYWQLPVDFMSARCRLELGQWDVARTEYDALLARPQVRENGDIYWLALYDRGRIAERDNDPEAALRHYRRAIDEVERLRSTINTEASKIGFVGDKQAVYFAAVRLLLEAGDVRAAFDYAERAKARALVDLLAQRQGLGRRARDRRSGDLLDALDQAERAARLQDSALSPQDHSRRRSAVAQTRSRLRQQAPELASLVTVSPASSEEVQALLGGTEALVEYYGYGERLIAFVVTARSIQGLEIEGAGLGREVQSLRRRVSDPGARRPEQAAQALHRRLIAPLELPSSGLTIVPHGPLHYVPFNALHDGSDYLVERYAIRLLPSASVLRFLDRGRDSRASRDLLVIGNPSLDEPGTSLRFAEEEARIIAGERDDVTLLLREKATETAVKQLSGQFRSLHFASHARFSPDRPLASGLLLSADDDNDGTLTVGELYDLELDAQLVTLSACETGLGKVASGDDVIGFSRGFLYAGADAIVASLWPVDDRSTKDLMTAFYRVPAETDRREALRRAQLTVKRVQPHPFAWGAFQFTGRVRPHPERAGDARR